MPRQFDIFVNEAPDLLTVHWGWVVALGLLIGLLGLVAIWRARTATFLYVGFIGALLLVSAVAILIFAFSLTGYWTDFFVHVLWAVLLAVVGLILVTRPGISAEAITLMVALYLIATGIFGIGFAFSAHIENSVAKRLPGPCKPVPWRLAARGLAAVRHFRDWSVPRRRLDAQRRLDRRLGIEAARDFGVRPVPRPKPTVQCSWAPEPGRMPGVSGAWLLPVQKQRRVTCGRRAERPCDSTCSRDFGPSTCGRALATP